MVLSTTSEYANDWEDPTILNSNLFPVKANGEVRLRSVSSRVTLGISSTPMSISSGFTFAGSLPCAMWLRIAVR